MIVGVVRTKMFAIILGTFGVGIISQLLNFYQFVILVSSLGITLGLTKYVSEWEKDGLWNEIKLIIGQANTLLVIISIFVIAVSFAFARKISLLLLQSEEYYMLIILLSFSIPFALLSAIFDSFIKGLRRFNSYLAISIVSSVLSLIANLLLVYYFQLFGAVIALTITAVIAIVSYIYYFRRTQLFSLSDCFSFNFKYSKKFVSLIRLAFAYLFVGSNELISQMVLRSLIIVNLGLNNNGIYQSVYNLSMSYFSILFMSLGIYLLPTLSALKDRELVNIEINNTLRLTFTIIVPLLCILFVFREFIIIILYSREFLPSTDLLFYSFIGDYFRAFSGVIGTWLVPDSRIKAWIVMSTLYYYGFVLLFILIGGFLNIGLKGVVISYLISNLLFAALNYWYIAKENNFRFSSVNRKLFPFSLLIIIVILFVSNMYLSIGYFILLPVMIIWYYLSFSREEVQKTILLLKSKLTKK